MAAKAVQSTDHPPDKIPPKMSAPSIDDAGYRRLVELSPMPIAVHIQGVVVYANQAAARLMKVESPEQLIGRQIMDFVHPDSQELVKRRVALLYREGRQHTDIVKEKLLRTDGEVIEVEIASLLFEYEGSSAIQLILRDITQSKKVEEALQHAKAEAEIERQRLHDLFMQAPACIAMLRGPDHIFDLANPEYMDLVGPERKVLGRPVREAFPEVIDQGFVDLLDIVYRTGEAFYGQETKIEFVEPSGSARTTKYLNFVYQPTRDADGKVAGILVHAIDVTSQVKDRQELRKSEERFRQLADSMPQMVWTADHTGQITYRNHQWYDFTDLGEIEPASPIWKSLIHPDERSIFASMWREAVIQSTPFQYEHRMRPYNTTGGYRWFLARAVPVLDSDGKVAKWFGTSTDITDLRRTAKRKAELERITAALTEQRAQLIALNQAKDEFISLASHQLRTPATGVKQYLGMVLDGFVGDLTPDLRLFLERAYESNERQITIVNDLLQVAQIDAGKVRLEKEEVDVVEMIHSVIHEQSSSFGKRQQSVSFKPSRALLKVRVDKSRLRMVLENIIDNASKYTPAGKSIYISTAKLKNKVKVTIADEGVGIDPGDIDKIFRKFSRVDNPLSAHAGGSGLGLYWVKKIIDLHDGTVTVKSELGKGTSFILTLPS